MTTKKKLEEEFDYEQFKKNWDKKFGKGEFAKFEKKWNKRFGPSKASQNATNKSYEHTEGWNTLYNNIYK